MVIRKKSHQPEWVFDKLNFWNSFKNGMIWIWIRDGDFVKKKKFAYAIAINIWYLLIFAFIAYQIPRNIMSERRKVKKYMRKNMFKLSRYEIWKEMMKNKLIYALP